MKGLTALVTGSTFGIGLGVAKTLAARECNVIVTGLGSQETIDRCLEEVNNAGCSKISAQFIGADLRQPKEVQSLCDEALRRYPKGVDILVNNAAIIHRSTVENYSLETWDDVIAVNLTAPFLMIKNLLPRMKKNDWGRIVNMSSVHGLVGDLQKAPYTSAKHGLIGLTKVVALETARTGITCNAVCPGWVPTETNLKFVKEIADAENITEEEAIDSLLERLPSGRPIEVEEVSELVAYLSSPAAVNITGAAIPIDGGWVAR